MREKILLREHSWTTEPVALLGTDIQLIQSKYSSKLKLERPLEGSGYNIKSSSFIGVYNLDGYQVIVNPKVHMSRVFKMLCYAYDLDFFSPSQAQYESFPEFFEYLIEIFQKKILRLIKNGLYSNYIDRKEALKFVKGRINQKALILSAWQKERIVCDFDEYDNDILENQIIKCTIERISRSSVIQNRVLRNNLKKANRYFQHISYRQLSYSDFAKVQYHVLNAHYEPILLFCKMIWELIGIHERTGNSPFNAYSLDMNLLFEKYIEKLLKSRLGGLKVVPQRRTYLDVEKDYLIKPDIVLVKNDIPALVIDTKYKIDESSSSQDVMQMFGYMNNYEVNGVLLYPRFEIQEKENNLGNYKLYTRTYDTDNLDKSADELVEWLYSVTNSVAPVSE